MNRAALSLEGGFLTSHMYGDGWIGVAPNASLGISYYQVEPKQPQLLDGGVLDAPAGIRISPYGKAATGQAFK